MAGFTMTEANEILKHDYLPVIREQLPTKTPLYARLTKGSEDVVGDEARMALRIGRNEGIGARANGGALPTAGKQTYKQIAVSTKNIYGRLQIDGKVFKAAKNNRGAFINAADAEMKGLLEGLQWDLNRQLFNESTGTLANVNAVSSSNTMTIGSSNASYKTRWIHNGMLVDVYNAAGTLLTAAGGVAVSALSKSAGTFTISGSAITVPAGGGFVVRAGAKGNELTGLKEVLTADTTLYGIDRSVAANQYFNPQVLANSGTDRAISEVLLQKAIDESQIAAGGNITLMISDHGVRRGYQDLLQALKRFTEPTRLVGGWTALEYNGIPWVTDPDCIANKIYLLDESAWKLHVMTDDVFEWGEEDGQLLRQVTGYDSYEAWMVGYMELVCDTPAKQVVLDDLKEDTAAA